MKESFRAEHVGVGKVIRFFEAFVSEPGDIEAGFPALSSEVQKFRMSPFLPEGSSDLPDSEILLHTVLAHRPQPAFWPAQDPHWQLTTSEEQCCGF